MLEALNNHLQEVADIWPRNESDEVNIIDLAAPIEVGTEIFDNKNPATEVTKEQKKCENIRDLPKRNSKRKAIELYKGLADAGKSNSDFGNVRTNENSAKPIKVPKLSNSLEKASSRQVGTEIFDNKNPATEVTKEQKKCENIRDLPKRNSKRKAIELYKGLADAGKSNSDFGNVRTNENSAKPIKVPKLSNSLEKASSSQDKIFDNLIVNKVESPLVLEDYDSDESDNDDLNSLRRKHAQKQKKVNDTVVATEIYPRRIELPNPSKPKATDKTEKPKALHKSLPLLDVAARITAFKKRLIQENESAELKLVKRATEKRRRTTKTKEKEAVQKAREKCCLNTAGGGLRDRKRKELLEKQQREEAEETQSL